MYGSMFMFTSYTTKKLSNFIHNFINNQLIFYTFQLQICSMTERFILFIGIAKVEGVGDIMAKLLSLR
jgi:hypothetical protein